MAEDSNLDGTRPTFWQGCCCGLVIAASPLLAALYISYGVFTLVDDYAAANECASGLWVYVLTSVIFRALSVLPPSSKKETTDEARNEVLGGMLCCLGFVEGGFAAWGGTQIWGTDHSCVASSKFLVYAKCTFGLQSVVFASVVVFIPVMLCVAGKVVSAQSTNNDNLIV
tara:strand:+ start:8282 stop:8791 length:510 start_codon:yes stop_codon:yes gene_type:complete